MWPLDRWVPVSVGERKQQKWNHLKFSILFAALLRFFFIRSFRFQFVPSLSNIDFQLLVSFFSFFRRLETLFDMSNIRCRIYQQSKLVSIERNKLHFPAGAKHRLAQIGWGFFLHTPYFFRKLIYRLACWAGRKATLDTQIPWTSALCMRVCSFIELSVA